MKRIAIGVAALAVLGTVGCASTPSPQIMEPSIDLTKAAEINVKLGTEYFKRGNLKSALEKLERAVQQNPRLPSAHNVLALLKQHLGKTEEAERHFQQAIDLDPNYSGAHNNYGVFLYSQGRYQEAEAQFLKAIENPLYDTPALAYENAAMAAQQRSYPEKAKEYYRKALQIQPQLPTSLYQLAQISFEEGRYRQAREYFRQYESVAQQQTPQSLWLGIRIERELGDQDAVSSYALQLRQRFPDSGEAKLLRRTKLLRKIQRGRSDYGGAPKETMQPSLPAKNEP